MAAEKREFSVEKTDTRIDRLVSEKAGDVSRARVAKLIEEGCVRCNGTPVTKPAFKPAIGDTVTLFIPTARECETAAEDIVLEVVYEDSDLIVINKPSGMVVHPAAGHSSGTLVNALLHHTKDLSGIGGVMRPGIVHRLDRDTSGLILVAKNDRAHQSLTAQFKDREVGKTYLAIVYGEISKKRFAVDLPIGRSSEDRKKMAVVESATHGARPAYTEFETLVAKKGFTLVKAFPKTGRTHQIRVHLSHVGFPIVGDPIYLTETLKKLRRGHEREFKRLWLHAEGIEFTHPTEGKKLEFHTGLPDEFDFFIKNI